MSASPADDSVHRASSVARWTRLALTAAIAIVIFAMMALTTADVAGRALFSKPIKGSYEIVTFLLAILIFCALPLVTWDEKHINVRLFDHWIAAPIQRALALLWAVIMTLIMAGITWRMWIQADLMAEGRHVTGFLEWPIAPIVYFMSALSCVTTVILAIQTWQKFLGGGRAAAAPGVSAENPGAD
jgi:TRAP-type C4-dicarboxylate transport system permease small subunit